MIFFYYGENSFQARQKIEAIVQKFQSEIDKNRHNIEHLDGENISADEFFQAITAAGFLADKKLIIIRNILENKKLADWQENLIDFLKKQKDTKEENYIIFWETSKPDGRSKLYKLLQKFKFVEEFGPLTPAELNTWITKKAKQYKKEIDNEAISLLISYVGDDLWQLNHEINKLANFSEDKIRTADVKKLVQAKIDDSIFNLVDAIGGKNKALALELIEDQLNSGGNAQYILNMVIRQFRLLIKAKSLASQIKYPGALAQALKLPNWIAAKTLEQSKLYTTEQLKNIYHKLFVLDEKFKTSSQREKILFDQMINSL